MKGAQGVAEAARLHLARDIRAAIPAHQVVRVRQQGNGRSPFRVDQLGLFADESLRVKQG